MASNTLDQKIKERIQSFVSEITYLVKQSAVESVKKALGDSSPVRVGAARPKPEPAPREAAARGKPACKRIRRRGKGVKRSPRQIANVSRKILEHVKNNPGLRIEQVAAGLEMSTRDLSLPIKKLIADKKIVKKGEKRATTYFVR